MTARLPFFSKEIVLSLRALSASASQRPHLANDGEHIGGGQPEQKHSVQRLQRTRQLPVSFQKEARVTVG